MLSFPWAPIYSIERSGRTEVTVTGAISIIDGKENEILDIGDTSYVLWTRSCLKAWQLLAHLPVLKASYPQLKPHHYALMMSSHSAEEIHLKTLDEISEIGKVSQEKLQCPATYPMAQADRIHLKDKGAGPNSKYNNCSGKHMGYLLAMKAGNLPSDNYLAPEGKQFEPLRQLLAYLLKSQNAEFPTTVDGCRIPNYAFAISDLAKLYTKLGSDFTVKQIQAAPKHLQEMLREWTNLRSYMHDFPEIIGGKNRIDTRIMQGELTESKDVELLSKQGADGLLAISLLPNAQYPTGLGIVIKLASGTDMHHMETIVKEIFHQLGLRAEEKADPNNAHLHNNFHFEIKATACKTMS
ncbi:MAG: asparaginase [Candidatus Obscuribacterales bacterium]|nr:asparaginase [Candidatus Obscuribacterales bacterium]